LSDEPTDVGLKNDSDSIVFYFFLTERQYIKGNKQTEALFLSFLYKKTCQLKNGKRGKKNRQMETKTRKEIPNNEKKIVIHSYLQRFRFIHQIFMT
jgi:hypothetical protein